MPLKKKVIPSFICPRSLLLFSLVVKTDFCSVLLLTIYQSFVEIFIMLEPLITFRIHHHNLWLHPIIALDLISTPSHSTTRKFDIYYNVGGALSDGAGHVCIFLLHNPVITRKFLACFRHLDKRIIEKQIKTKKSGSSSMGQDHTATSPWTGCSQFLPTTQKIIQFSDGKAPKPTDKIVSTHTHTHECFI